MPLSPTEYRQATKIARWNTAHGDIFRAADRELDKFITACSTCRNDMSADNVAGLNEAGVELAVFADSALQHPLSGVPEYDDPRLAALQLYKQAGQRASRFDPNTDDDPNGLLAAMNLDTAREYNAEATAFAQELLTKATS